MPQISVVIADDQHLFAESLKWVLHAASEGQIDVLGTASNGSEAIELVDRLSPDVVLMDIRMPVMDGVVATQRIKESHPDTAILILTTFDDDELAVNALSCGATGYVLKEVDPPDLIHAIEAVYGGGFYISKSVGFKLVDTMREKSDDRTDIPERLILALRNKVPALSQREAEIACYTAKAHHAKRIADSLSISEKTVRNHLTSIYAKLGIHSRLELMRFVGEVDSEQTGQ